MVTTMYTKPTQPINGSMWESRGRVARGFHSEIADYLVTGSAIELRSALHGDRQIKVSPEP